MDHFNPLLTILIAFLLFQSCSKHDNNHPSKQDSSNVISIEQAIDDAVYLRSMLFSDCTKSGNNISVDNIQIIGNSLTKGQNTNDTLLYVINFADSAGYVVLPADKRIQTPFAVTESGSYVINSPALTHADSVNKFFIEAIAPNVALSILSDVTDSKTIKDAGFTIKKIIEHKLRTAWGQNNQYFEGTGYKHSGCVATALAQIFTYYNDVLEPLYISGNYINFQNLLSESRKNGKGTLNNHSNPESREDVASLQLWIGQSSDAKYTPDGTPISSKKALKFAKSIGYETAPDMYNYDVERIYSGLQEGKITYMTGSDKAKYFIFENWSWPVGGHAWIVDGYAEISKGNNNHKLVHVNWGWGGYGNGYYYDGIFYAVNGIVADSGEIIKMPSVISLTKGNDDGNYCFFLEMSHVFPLKWKNN